MIKKLKKLPAMFLAFLMVFGGSQISGQPILVSAQTVSPHITFVSSEIPLITKPGGKLYLMVGVPDTDLTWEISDPLVATVSSRGVVTGVSIGETKITAKLGDKYYIDCDIIVYDETLIEHISSIEVTTSGLYLYPEKTYQIFADVYWEGQFDDYTEARAECKVIWNSSSPGIASVKDGLIKGINTGKATISATSVDGGLVAKCEVTVNEESVNKSLIIPKSPLWWFLVIISFGLYYYFNPPVEKKPDPTPTPDPTPDPSTNDGRGVVTGYVNKTQAIRKNDQLTFTAGSATTEKEKFVNFALSQVDYHEGKSCGIGKDRYGNSDPGKPARIYFPSSSNDNWTKYGYLYNGSYSGSWCAVFVSVCADEVGISTDKIERSTYASMNINKSGYFKVDNKAPQPGDLFYYTPTGNNKVTDHIGIVTGYNSSTNVVSTVEGISSDKVRAREYDLYETNRIKGFYRF